MNTTQHTDDTAFLDPFVAAAYAASDTPGLTAAADRFRNALPAPAAPRRRFWAVPRFATLAILITSLAISVPMMIPGGSGTAFAQVQQWFTSYRTLDVTTRIASGDAVVVDVRARVDAIGNVRIDQTGVTQIVDAAGGTFTTLLPGDRYMQQPISGVTGGDAGLEWVDKLAAFRGEAVPLAVTRMIENRPATGHRLVIDQVDLVLWSDVTDSRPLLLEGTLPGGLELTTTFDFDVPLSPTLYRIPDGYLPVTPE